jgi:hypothetical protein
MVFSWKMEKNGDNRKHKRAWAFCAYYSLYKGAEILRRGGGVKRKLLFDPHPDPTGGDG